MPSLKAIRKRIVSVKSTQKITKAMKMVAAAKLRRAQRAIVDARPYAQKLHTVLSALALRAELSSHPLLARPENPKRAVMIVLSSDRGLCGSFNSSLLRSSMRFLQEKQASYAEGIGLVVCGKKGRDFFRRRNVQIVSEHVDVLAKPSVETARTILADVVQEFADGKLDEVYIACNEFRSAISQQTVISRLLPIEPLPPETLNAAADFIYEPNKAELLNHLVPLYLEVELYRDILESIASEFGARMTAMDAASRNSRELLSSLTLEFNRARQAAITKELVEIVSGAETLKG